MDSLFLFYQKFVNSRRFQKYHDDSPYLSGLKLHVYTKADIQTVLFFNIQTFMLPEDKVTEEFKSFFISHPF